MSHPDSSSVVDPDPFPNFSYNSGQRPLLQRQFALLHTSSPKRSVHFESPLMPRYNSIPSVKRYGLYSSASNLRSEYIPKKVSSMASSGCVDDEGFDGPGRRSVGTLTERRLSHRSTSVSSVPALRFSRRQSQHNNDGNEERNNPWNWPKLPPVNRAKSDETNDMTNQTKDVLTKSQLEFLRSFLTAPKPLQLTTVDEAARRRPKLPLPQNQDLNITKKLSTVPRTQIGDPWDTPQQQFPANQLQSKNKSTKSLQEKKPGSSVKDYDSDLDPPPPFEEPKTRTQPSAALRNNQQEKKKHSNKGKASKEKQSNQCLSRMTEPPQYGYVDSSSSKKLPSGLEKHSPTYKDKIHGWPMDPASSPPLEPEIPPASRRSSSSRAVSVSRTQKWGSDGKRSNSKSNDVWQGEDREDVGSGRCIKNAIRSGVQSGDGREKSGSLISKFDDDKNSIRLGTPHAEYERKSDWRRSISGSRESKKSVYSFHMAETSRNQPSIGAGTVIWADPVDITGAGAELWGDPAGLCIMTKSPNSVPHHRSASQRESRNISHHSASQRSVSHPDSSQRTDSHSSGRDSSKQRMTIQDGDHWGLDPILEDESLKSQGNRSKSSRASEMRKTTTTSTQKLHTRSGSQQPPSPTKSAPQRASVSSSYRAPAVEDDMTNWAGWKGPDWPNNSPHKSKSPSKSSEGKRSPKDLTPHRSSSRHTTPKQNDIVNAWISGKVPSEASQRTGYEPQLQSREYSSHESQDQEKFPTSPTHTKEGSILSHRSGKGHRSKASSKHSSKKLDWEHVQTGDNGFF
jgi:hypothetical protein